MLCFRINTTVPGLQIQTRNQEEVMRLKTVTKHLLLLSELLEDGEKSKAMTYMQRLFDYHSDFDLVS